jgi:MoaA/NifB/PqqE/SkfB family radical SAM enzyme
MTKCINVNKGLRFTNSGEAMFCCKSETWLDDSDGNRANIETHTFDEVINGRLATEIRNDLESGVKNVNCKKCWEEEDAGLSSKRILDNNRAIKYWGEEYLNNSDVKAEIVELNLGTICNLKCRICGPWSSSKWVKEHYAVNNKNNTDFKTYMKQVKQWQGNWEDDSKSWTHIEDNLSHLKQIDFYGGEPFLVDRNWEILKKSVDSGYSKNQVLHFNTNGTLYNEEHIEILKQFKQVLISLSIDDIKERFEYQRHPAKWDIVNENLQKFSKLNQEKNFDVQVCITVNTLNVFYIPELIEYLLTEAKLGYYINFLHGPEYYNVRNIKQNIKEVITQKYSESKQIHPMITDLQKILSYMNNYISSSGPWQSFLEQTSAKDKYRKETFSEVFPEWFSIIKDK